MPRPIDIRSLKESNLGTLFNGIAFSATPSPIAPTILGDPQSTPLLSDCQQFHLASTQAYFFIDHLTQPPHHYGTPVKTRWGNGTLLAFRTSETYCARLDIPRFRKESATSLIMDMECTLIDNSLSSVMVYIRYKSGTKFAVTQFAKTTFFTTFTGKDSEIRSSTIAAYALSAGMDVLNDAVALEHPTEDRPAWQQMQRSLSLGERRLDFLGAAGMLMKAKMAIPMNALADMNKLTSEEKGGVFHGCMYRTGPIPMSSISLLDKGTESYVDEDMKKHGPRLEVFEHVRLAKPPTISVHSPLVRGILRAGARKFKSLPLTSVLSKYNV